MIKRAVILVISLVSIVLAQEIGARYLIITHDNFYNDVIPLAQWKHKKGMRTKVVKLSQIGSDSTAIKNYVTNAYNTWQVRPEYILLVGAPNYLPFPVIGSWNTDNYYTDITGDLHNEILSGRLTVHNPTEAQTVVNKILLYERYPNTTDSLWFTDACLIANEDYGVYPPQGGDTLYWNDIRHVKSLMLANGYHTIDTLSCGLGNSATDVINAVNNGRSFVVYRGQGLNNWWSPFGVNPDMTANGSKLPIVLSMTCCCIGTGSTPAVAEKWLLTGTPTTPRGGAGYFATTTVGGGFITFLRSRACRGFFNALFTDHKRTFGECCEGGRQLVYNTYGDADEYRGLTTLGDPEMNIWTYTPCSLVVNHPQAITIGNASFTINVTDASNSLPVSGAVVSVVGRSDTMVYTVDSTDGLGNSYFNINPQIVDDTIYVTVTGKNLKPYEGQMLTFAPGCYVGYLKSAVDDTLGGNGDGVVNPDEQINLPLWVRNFGDSTAVAVSGTLHSDDGYVTITDSIRPFGTILGGDSAFTGNDGYDFTVAPNAPDGHVVDFILTCQDINDSVWISYFNTIVHAAQLVFQQAVISGGNGNSNVDPNETVTVAITLKNDGSAGIDSVTAHLHSLSPYVSILDSSGMYDHFSPGSSATNNADPFMVYSEANTPPGTTAGFLLILNSGYYYDTLEFSLCIGQEHYYIWNPDATPAPGENMHALLSGLGYSGDIGTTLTADLNLYQSVWVCAGVYPNNYIIANGSPEAAALVDYAQNGGCVYLEGGDVWYYDPMGGGYDFGPLFGINATADGGSDMGPVVGQTSTFTQSMNFNYSGENSWMDHIDPTGTGFLVFHDGNDSYNCGVANNAATYRTVGTSFELGLLTDGSPPSTRAMLLDSIMHFFNITTGIEEKSTFAESDVATFEIRPNPFRSSLQITCHAGLTSKGSTESGIDICIYDVAGRLVRTFKKVDKDDSVVWSGDDDLGRQLPGGIYFVHFMAQEVIKTYKAVLLR
jgi:hypothetical protein